MSATLDLEDLSKRLPDIQPVYCPVRQHPVSVEWSKVHSLPLEQQIVNQVVHFISQDSGDMLVFLPGVAEINRCRQLLESRIPVGCVVHPLHSGLSIDKQKLAIDTKDANSRKIILSTSLAETSITIEGVTTVIDSGLERRGICDNRTNAVRLETVTASQASATQRAGRAGRTGPGHCIRLWAESDHSRRAAHWQPEIYRADLAPLLLELCLWGISDYRDLPWLEEPPQSSIARASDLLQQLSIIDTEGKLTPHGNRVAGLPVHPRLGHMLVWAADNGVLDLACRLAVMLEDFSSRKRAVDLQDRLNEPLLHKQHGRAKQLKKLLSVSVQPVQGLSASILIAQAFPDWIARNRHTSPGAFQLACGVGVVINADDALAHSEWLSVAELGGIGSTMKIYAAMALDVEELEFFSPEFFSHNRVVQWDKTQQRIQGVEEYRLDRIVVRSKRLVEINPDEKSEILLATIREQGLACLPWTDQCRELQTRARWMRTLNMSDQTLKWPDLSDEHLLTRLSDWLLPWITDCTGFKELQKINLFSILLSQLDYQQQSLLDTWLPIRYKVPSGSLIKLRYELQGNPVLSVKLQEMFGSTSNPAIANGQLPLKVELLSPAKRVVQVTDDLVNFWQGSYQLVKKDLAGRYPKHPWPDDPMTAIATAATKKQMKSN